MRDRLLNHVKVITEDIGERNVYQPDNLDLCKYYIISKIPFCYDIDLQTYIVNGEECTNIECIMKGRTDDILIVSAHYDSLEGTVGANDNASAVSCLLEIMELFRGEMLDKTIKFVFFVNEEPPFFNTPDMGSFRYYELCKQRNDNIIGMITLDCVGCYSGIQRFISDFNVSSQYSNFIMFTGSEKSRSFIEKCYQLYKQSGLFPVEMITDMNKQELQFCNFSDHRWFNEFGSIMVTDTAFMRYPWYHHKNDTYDKLDYGKMSDMLNGLYTMIRRL